MSFACKRKIKFYTVKTIKEELGLQILRMLREMDENGNKTEWVSHWEKDRRIRVTMHEIVMEKIRANIDIDTLVLNKEVISKNNEEGEYIRYTISNNLSK